MKDREYTIYIIVSHGGQIKHVVNRIKQLDFDIVWERVCAADCMSLLKDTIPEIVIIADNNSAGNLLREIGSKYEKLSKIVISDSDCHSKGLRMIEEGAEDYIFRSQIERLDFAITRVLRKNSSLQKKIFDQDYIRWRRKCWRCVVMNSIP